MRICRVRGGPFTTLARRISLTKSATQKVFSQGEFNDPRALQVSACRLSATCNLLSRRERVSAQPLPASHARTAGGAAPRGARENVVWRCGDDGSSLYPIPGTTISRRSLYIRYATSSIS
eukprot:6187264-Pleurochrysis_carterae.AAC.11